MPHFYSIGLVRWMSRKNNVYYFPKNPPQKRREKNIKPLGLIYILILIICVYFFLHSPVFNISNIEVIGNKYLAQDKILELSQISKGTNLFKINKKNIKENIAVQPLVKNVQITRKLPSTLVINVIEHKPVGLVVCEDGFIQVSEIGTFLSLSRQIGDYKLPVISGINMEYIPGPGQAIENQGLSVALSILKKIDSSLLESLVEINVQDTKHILAYTLHGIEIKLGSQNDMENKLIKLQEILNDIVNSVIDENSIEYIDLRFPNSPVYKKKIF